jgi:hypothetical protein
MAVGIVGLMIVCAVKIHELKEKVDALNTRTELLLKETIELERLMDEKQND